MTIAKENFNPLTYDLYGQGQALRFVKKSTVKRYAKLYTGGEVTILNADWTTATYKPDENGVLTIPTREGDAKFTTGNWIVRDDQGGFYPVANTKTNPNDKTFSELYFVEDGQTEGIFLAKPKKVTMFRTDVEFVVKTKWGDYTASVGDWVVLNPDGTLGCPVKPDAVASGYELVE